MRIKLELKKLIDGIDQKITNLDMKNKNQWYMTEGVDKFLRQKAMLVSVC